VAGSSNVDTYQSQLRSQNGRFTPGLGEPISNTSTFNKQLNSALNQLKSALIKLQKIIGK
jgi:hypothetical protein